jgi:hypothetical protein
MRISRYRRRAIEDGFLVQVKGHKRPVKGGDGEATEFLFDVSRFKCLETLAK